MIDKIVSNVAIPTRPIVSEIRALEQTGQILIQRGDAEAMVE